MSRKKFKHLREEMGAAGVSGGNNTTNTGVAANAAATPRLIGPILKRKKPVKLEEAKMEHVNAGYHEGGTNVMMHPSVSDLASFIKSQQKSSWGGPSRKEVDIRGLHYKGKDHVWPAMDAIHSTVLNHFNKKAFAKDEPRQDWDSTNHHHVRVNIKNNTVEDIHHDDDREEGSVRKPFIAKVQRAVNLLHKDQYGGGDPDEPKYDPKEINTLYHELKEVKSIKVHMGYFKGPVRVWLDPTPSDMGGIVNTIKNKRYRSDNGERAIRGIVHNGHHAYWDAREATHNDVHYALDDYHGVDNKAQNHHHQAYIDSDEVRSSYPKTEHTGKFLTMVQHGINKAKDRLDEAKVITIPDDWNGGEKKIWQSPVRGDMKGIVQGVRAKRGEHAAIRGLTHKGKHYMWDARDTEHNTVHRALDAMYGSDPDARAHHQHAEIGSTRSEPYVSGYYRSHYGASEHNDRFYAMVKHGMDKAKEEEGGQGELDLKEAKIHMVDAAGAWKPVKMYAAPTKSDMPGIIRSLRVHNVSGRSGIRGLIHGPDKKLHVWDAHEMTHEDAKQHLDTIAGTPNSPDPFENHLNASIDHNTKTAKDVYDHFDNPHNSKFIALVQHGVSKLDDFKSMDESNKPKGDWKTKWIVPPGTPPEADVPDADMYVIRNLNNIPHVPMDKKMTKSPAIQRVLDRIRRRKKSELDERAPIAPAGGNRGRNPYITTSDDENEPMPGTPEHEAWLRKKLQGSGIGLGEAEEFPAGPGSTAVDTKLYSSPKRK